MINAAVNLDGVRPRRPSGRKGTPKQKSVTRRFLKGLRSRAMVLVATAGFSAIMVGIVLNATLFQKGHHPAPLFAPAPSAAVAPLPVAKPVPVAPAPAAMPEAVEPVAAQVAPIQVVPPVAAPQHVARPVQHPVARPASHTVAHAHPHVATPATPKHVASKPHDGIAQLLSGSKPSVPHHAPAIAPAATGLRPPAAIPQVID